MERFGDANAAIGKQIRVNDVLVTIIGVTPLRFRGPVQSGEARNLWMPLSSWQLVAAVSDTVFVSPDAQAFEALARLQPGVSVAEAVTASDSSPRKPTQTQRPGPNARQRRPLTSFFCAG